MKIYKKDLKNIKNYNEHISYLDDFSDPEEKILLVGLPSGECFEIKRKDYYEIQNIANWSERYKCYTYRDKNYNDIKFLIEPNKKEYNKNQDYIHVLLENMNIKNYEIINRRVNVLGDVILKNMPFDKLPVNFYKIEGDFIITHGVLETLDNFPEIVNGNFDVSYNNLYNLKNGPKIVNLYYNCSHNNLNSLYGSPLEVWTFDCSYNNLKDLNYSPVNVHVDFNCSNNQIVDISRCPKRIGRTLNCSNNELYSLSEIPNGVQDIISSGNPIHFMKKDNNTSISNTSLKLTTNKKLFVNDKVVFYDENLKISEGICLYESDFLKISFKTNNFFGKFTIYCYIKSLSNEKPSNKYIYYNDHLKSWYVIKVEKMFI